MLKVLLLLFLLGFAFSQEVIITTTYPLYYPLRFMAEGRYRVEVLLEKEADPHHYELKPSDIKRLRQAKAFIYLGVEAWELNLSKLVLSKSYSLTKGLNLIKSGRFYDPHLWMSPKAYAGLVENMYKVLLELDPAGKEVYTKRKEEFLKRLTELDQRYKSVLKTCKSKTVVITHQSLAYLARGYGLRVVGIKGVHAEEEPKPSEIKKLVKTLQELPVKSLFYELGQDKSLAESVAKQAGARVFLLNTSLLPQNPKDDYFSIMERNLHNLATGLGCLW
ncbi:MAG: zinc ABC transporter substrate-binding protein [Aquificota bacterium]|nr:MAG: zinc ABC transporter substrate-binding protein [Aquificota bacterium]